MLETEGIRSNIVGARADGMGWRIALAGLIAGIALGVGSAGALGAPVQCSTQIGAPTCPDDSGGAHQILAPGAEGSIPPGEFSSDQSKLYSALTPKEGNVTPGAVAKDYLSEKFGVQGSPLRTEETGRPGLEIARDSHDVAHIFGETRSDVMFGSGWVAAKDRGLLLKFGLGPAFVAALSVPGLNAFELLLTQRTFKPSAEAEEFVSNQLAALREKGPRGEQVIEDLEAWVEGVNAAAVPGLQHVTLTDAIAGFAFIGSIFGNGGGAEVTNSNFLAKLEAKFGESEGLKIFHDLRESNDPEAPTTATTPYPYDEEPTGTPPAGAAVVEPGTESPSALTAAAALKASHRKASNFLLIGAGDTKTGHPVAVMGPQLGYFYPEIVFQADLHGPGVDASGVVAPISPYVFIGRGRDFAWSLTSADSENTQQFLLKLCNPEVGGPVTRATEFYEHDGECIPMTTFDAGELGASETEHAHEVFFKESIYGPVSGTVMVGGQPYAIATDRSTRGREPAGELAFSDFDSDRVHTPQQFFEAANELETTFNMAYLDSKNIAYFSTGRLPELAPGTDAALPTFGTGPYDWRGFLSLAEHPHVVNPPTSLLLNWNNKPAPGWGAASDNYDYGPLHRVQLYKGFTSEETEAGDVSVMNKAATQDFRAVEVWPTIEKVLAATPPATTLESGALKLMKRWVATGASRYGKEGPKASAAEVMDAIWNPIAETVLGPTLGNELLGELKSIHGIDNNENSGGSSYGGGWYGYVYKDLRSLLGEPVASPYSHKYCGGGSLETCSKELWSAIGTALEHVAETQSTKIKKWKAAKVHIEFPPGGQFFGITMPWTNRSTFQQVIEFEKHEEEDLEGPLE